MSGGAVRLAACAAAAVAAAFAFASSAWSAPIAVSALDAPYAQDFDTLAASGSSATLPDGWAISETGTSAKVDGQYTAGTGSSNTGDTYSFGAAAAGDRALGSLLSGTISESFGAAFTNDTGETVTSLDVAYTGEQWRLGQAGRGPDRLDFQVSTDATSLTTGTWTDVDALDFSSPVTAGTVGALDGNAAANRAAVSGNAGGLAVAPGQTVWIRWVDVNVSGSDDGLAVDDLSVTARGSGGTAGAPVVASCGGAVSTEQGTPASTTVTASDADGRVGDIHLGAISPATSGIAVTSFAPALTAGGTATATIGVDASTPAGTYAVTVVAANDDATPQTGQCTLSVNVQAPPTVLPIGAVQGSVPDDADGATFRSPYVGKQVTVRGVVTELTFDGGFHGFYLQNTAAEADDDPNSSDGIFVFTSTFTDLKNGYVPVVGDDIRLTGTVSEHFDQTEIGSATATKLGTGAVTPFVADPPSDSADAARYWERREGMQATVPTGSVVDSPRHLYASSDDTELYVVAPDAPVALRSDPYARRAFRDAHPLDDEPGTFDNGNGYRILITDEGIKAADPSAQLPAVHTFQTIAAPVTGGVYYDFGSYSVSAAAQPQVADGADPAQNDPPQAFDRSQAYSIANFNMDNLYDYRDDPFDGCDFFGNPGCPGVSPPFDYPPASDAEYQQRETEIAHQIVADLHAPDVIVVAEAEDQDICTVQSWQLVCGTTNDADGKPDVLQELAIHVHQLGGPDYDAANDRDGADARGIVSGFLYRTDRVGLIAPAATDPVLGSSPAVQYRGAPLDYDTQVQNPKALNAVLPSDVDLSTGHDGSNVFTRAAQVAHFRIAPPVLGYSPADVWVIANHFTSGPDTDIGQRREQAAYNAALVKAIQSGDANAKVMVAGDLNDYPRPDDPIPPSAGGPSDQLAPLYGAGLHDLYDTVLANHPSSAYSYVFEGQAQDLDHQFVTPSFFSGLQAVNEAHVNADWTLDAPGDDRGTSDHDPMVSRWALPAGVTYDGVCDVVEQYTTNTRLQGTICTLLAKAEDDAAKGRRAQRALDLVAVRAAILVGVADGSFTRQEGVQLTKLLARL